MTVAAATACPAWTTARLQRRRPLPIKLLSDWAISNRSPAALNVFSLVASWRAFSTRFENLDMFSTWSHVALLLNGVVEFMHPPPARATQRPPHARPSSRMCPLWSAADGAGPCPSAVGRRRAAQGGDVCAPVCPPRSARHSTTRTGCHRLQLTLACYPNDARRVSPGPGRVCGGRRQRPRRRWRPLRQRLWW